MASTPTASWTRVREMMGMEFEPDEDWNDE